jgi:hypothetical protein
VPRRGFELGNRRPAVLRTGPDFRWGGMWLGADAGSVPANRARHLENVRFRNGTYQSRGGLSQVNSTALHHSSAKIADLQDFQRRTRKAYIMFTGCPGLSTTVGFSSAWYDQDQSPAWQRGVYYNGAANDMVGGKFDGRLYLGVDATLKVLQLINAPYGASEGLAIAGLEQAETLTTFTGFVIRCFQEFDGKLFIGLDAGAGASKIVTWDGLAFRDDLTGIDPPSAFTKWRNKLVVGFSTNPSGIRVRDEGDSPGTWAALVAGALASVAMTSYKDNVYITDGAADVWRYDGTTLASVRTIAGATIRGLTTYNDGSAIYLFYGYQSSGNAAIIGRFDGSSYVDVHYNITTTYPGARLPRVLLDYSGAIMAVTSTAATGGRLYISKGNDTDGTVAYTEVAQPSGGTSGALSALVF